MIQESPTLELVIDCSRFAIQHFEVISASSPHIYHSALVLTPRESIVRQLYKLHAQPFVRVVQGVSSFWNSNVAAVTNPSLIEPSTWSPCNRLIAISPGRSTPVDILDAVTLHLLQSLEFPQHMPLHSTAVSFSPDSRTLTSFICGHDYSDVRWFVVTWDLQTGGVVGAIEWRGPPDLEVKKIHITYSMNGKVVAILSVYRGSVIISIYDVISSVYVHNVDYRTRTNPDLGLETQYVSNSWAHGESFRFATFEPAGVSIREVGFTPGATVVEVETISIPDNIVEMLFKQSAPAPIEFHPPSCRLAFVTYGGSLVVWDLRTSRFMLHDPDLNSFSMTFSSDGRFFACTTRESGIYIWRESSNGYTVARKLTPSTGHLTSLLSPNGESIIAFSGTTIRLWHTNISTTTTSSVLPQVPQNTSEVFYLEFLPDEPLAVTARKKGNTITVVDLNSGIPQLTIDTSINVYGLRAIANTVVAIGDQKAITWNIPGGKFPPGARLNAEDGAHTIHFNITDHSVVTASISLDFQYVAFLRYTFREGSILDVYCTSTTKNLRIPLCTSGLHPPTTLWFAPGGHDLWCAMTKFEAKVFTIPQDTFYHAKNVPVIKYGAWGCPWGSSCGYQITEEGWVFRRDGKRLLMLPPLWRSSFGAKEVVWNGKFLGLLHGALLEPVILELEL
jgi:WD40 repeat protein